jgi:hypothetical protein
MRQRQLAAKSQGIRDRLLRNARQQLVGWIQGVQFCRPVPYAGKRRPTAETMRTVLVPSSLAT